MYLFNQNKQYIKLYQIVKNNIKMNKIIHWFKKTLEKVQQTISKTLDFMKS